jgi:nucleotide-binding universal stress UspA family protein
LDQTPDGYDGYPEQRFNLRGALVYRNILVPTDGSRLSDKAIREAIMLAKAGGAKLVLFHAVPPYRTPVYIEAMAVPSLPKQMGTRVSANKARRVLAAAGKKVQAAGIPMS